MQNIKTIHLKALILKSNFVLEKQYTIHHKKLIINNITELQLKCLFSTIQFDVLLITKSKIFGHLIDLKIDKGINKKNFSLYTY